ncbi:hypothetical protein ACPCG0_12810 [Propionibacteriaceae bacterium Y1923]|uniref:hypothetical protein n=1 Tax=Aestuariimicrobium sp. Y1814 TaxID=3418742 RepID=UPI003C283265
MIDSFDRRGQRPLHKWHRGQRYAPAVALSGDCTVAPRLLRASSGGEVDSSTIDT